MRTHDLVLVCRRPSKGPGQYGREAMNTPGVLVIRVLLSISNKNHKITWNIKHLASGTGEANDVPAFYPPSHLTISDCPHILTDRSLFPWFPFPKQLIYSYPYSSLVRALLAWFSFMPVSCLYRGSLALKSATVDTVNVLLPMFLLSFACFVLNYLGCVLWFLGRVILLVPKHTPG